jgi:hypothetical protein
MEDYSDSDTSLELEYESNQGSIPESNSEEDELHKNLEPNLSEPIYKEYDNALSNPQAQLQARLEAQRLAQLHAEIKARAQLPDPPYQKLSWS